MSINNTTLALITERAKALDNSNVSISKKVCLAAADLIYAEKHPDFAIANGGVENLKHDLGVFVSLWQLTI